MLGWQWPRAGPEAPAEAPATAEEVIVAEATAAAGQLVVAPSRAALETAVRKLGQDITNTEANSQPAKGCDQTGGSAAPKLMQWLKKHGHECLPCYDEAVTR